MCSSDLRRIFPESCRAGCSLFGQPSLIYLRGENGGSLGTCLSLSHDQSVITSVMLSQATRCVLLMCKLSSCMRVTHEAALSLAVSLTTVILLLMITVVFRGSTCFFPTPVRMVDWVVATRARGLSCLLRRVYNRLVDRFSLYAVSS